MLIGDEGEARTASANTIARREFQHRLAAAHAELAHNADLRPPWPAFAKDGTVQTRLKGRMTAHGVHAFLCTLLGCGPGRMGSEANH